MMMEQNMSVETELFSGERTFEKSYSEILKKAKKSSKVIIYRRLLIIWPLEKYRSEILTILAPESLKKTSLRRVMTLVGLELRYDVAYTTYIYIHI